MKKILLFAVCFLAVVSCKKHNNTEQPTPMVTISFDQRIVSGHSMVRSTSNDFLDIIEEQTPKIVTVTLKNTDLNKTYTCESTESITIPVGNYTMSATAGGDANGNSKGHLKTPLIKSPSQSIIVTSATDKIMINMSYECYAIFALIDECSTCDIIWGAYSGDAQKIGKYYVAYAVDNVEVMLKPYADSTDFSAATIKFVTTYNPTDTFAEFGKYYVVHPTKIDATTSSFDVQFPTMQEGEI